MDTELLIPSLDVHAFGMDDLGISVLPDGDFLAFLGDLAGPDPLDQGATTLPILPEPPIKASPPQFQVPAAVDVQTPWQVPTGLQLQKQASLRGSPCSSAASAEATNCPESPMISSPATSSGAPAPTGPSSTATAAAAAVAVTTRKRQRSQTQQPSAATQSSDLPEDSQDEDEEQPRLTKAQLAAAKRRAPVVDWRAIDDPEERRKQRRLAKNRITAARSRERKKEQMADMEQRMSKLEAENNSLRSLLQSMMSENTSLKEQLASLNRGAAAAPPAYEGSPKPAVLVKCLAIMHLVCCLLMCAKASLSLVVPLMSLVLQQESQAAGALASSCAVAAPQCSVSGAMSGSVAAREWWRVRLRPALSVC